MSASQRLRNSVASLGSFTTHRRTRHNEVVPAPDHRARNPSRPPETISVEAPDTTSPKGQNSNLSEPQAPIASSLGDSIYVELGEHPLVCTSAPGANDKLASSNDASPRNLQAFATATVDAEIEGGKIQHEKGKDAEFAKDLDTYQLPIASSDIYRFKSSDIWIAYESKLPISSTLQAKWDDYKQDLDYDLRVVELNLIQKHQQKTFRTSRVPHPKSWRILSMLRLSGKRNSHSDLVTISPCIWIYCGSEECRKEAIECINDLERPIQFSGQSPQIHVGGPVFMAARAIVPLAQLPMGLGGLSVLQQPETVILYHFELPNGERTVDSVCGTLCCSTLIRSGEILEQHFSRIGGLLDQILGDYMHHQVFGSVAMTTAHGILDQLALHEEQEGLKDMEQGTDYTFWNTDLCESDLDEESNIDGDDNGKYFFNLDEDVLGKRDPSDVARWQPFDGVVGINFLGKLYSENKHSVNAKSSTDYALLKAKAFDGFSNRLFSELGAAEITSYVANDELEQGSVSVIFGLDDVAHGTLLPRATNFPFNNGELALRTVELTKPLARGTSGTWLIKDAKFVGMIVAAYEGEPLALFISAEDIIVDILMSFPAERNPPSNIGSFGATRQHSQNASSIQAPTSTSSNPTTAIQIEEALDPSSKDGQRTSRPNTSNATQPLGVTTVFSSSRHSSKGYGSSKKYEYQWVWTCCQCGDSGMSCNSTPGCPNCNIFRCANCPLRQVKVRVA